MRTRVLGLATAIGTLLMAKGAFAQNKGFAMQQFEPAAAGDRAFGVPDASVAGHLAPYVNVIGNYGHKPLKLRDPASDTNLGYITKNQLYLHLDGSFALGDKVLLNVDVPFAATQGGNDFANSKVEGGKIADIRGGVRGNIVGKFDDPFAMGVQVDVWFPTGNEEALTGDGKFRANPKLVFSGVADMFYYAWNVGYLFRKHRDLGTPEIGDAITFGATAGLRLADNKVQIGPEIYGNTVLPKSGSDSPFLGTHSSPVEAILGAKVRAGDFVIGAAAGPGMTKTPGTPQFRALLSVGFQPEIIIVKDKDGDGINDPVDACPEVRGVASQDPKMNGCPAPPPPDRDHDMIIDSQDACPDVAGVANADPAKNGCPPDKDGDGIVDAADACPDVAGVGDPDPKKNGCPPDKDGDGIVDAQDACPDVAGVKSDDPKKNGCPPDKDGDGIIDSQDACPDQPGVADPDPKKNGCPKLATLVGKEIKISEQVHFETGKAVIKADSDKLLGEVAAILKENPQIDRLVVEGHTDNVGNKGNNQLLSKRRADAVKDWLVKKGAIDKKRIESAGYGQTKPIAPNDTEEGRAANRRVEFHVAKESVKSEGAAPPGGAAPKAPAGGGGAAPAPKK
jgi:OmpA-OmpF porin, OOP family